MLGESLMAGHKRERLTHIPANKVEEIVQSFTSEGAREIKKIQEPDGSWTVEAVFYEK